MPHLAATALSVWLDQQPNAALNTLALPAHISARASAGLQSDAVGLYYSACVSMSEALRGLCAGNFAWASVKLYYSIFYSARSILAFNGVAIFYRGRTPYSITTNAGERAYKQKGNTHEFIWVVMHRELPSFPLLNTIDLEPAYKWMKEIRERANYKDPKFSDPVVPPHFSAADSIGLDRAVEAYRQDTSLLYAFDPDHAAIAYPLEMLKRASASFDRAGSVLEAADQAHLVSCLPVPPLSHSPLPWR